jgi:CheY-like chemotaxis protein
MSNWKLLVVEDDPDGQEVVATILRHARLDAVVVDDAETAEGLIFDEGQIYDAIIIDLALPGKSGWDLLQDLQNTPPTRQMKCIAVTAFHSSKLREEAISAGFDAYFAKPIEATTFLRELGHILNS